MSRMLAALKQLESQQLLAPTLVGETDASTSPETNYEPVSEESNIRIDQAHAAPVPNSEFVPVAVGAGSTAGCLSSSAFWPSLELPTFTEAVEAVETADDREENPGSVWESGVREQESDVRSLESAQETHSTVDSECGDLSTLVVSESDADQDESPEETPAEIRSDDDSSHSQTEVANEHPLDAEVRQLATTILRKLPTGLPAALWITSAGGASDTSRLVADLGQAFCEDESLRVLAIDAQCGRAAQRVEHGFIQALEDPNEWQSSVRTTAVDGLSVMPGGVGSVVRASEHEASLKPLLDNACRDYDLVLIDGGAVDNPVTDRMAAECDGSLVLARLGETDRRHARQAVDSLVSAEANVLGCVIAGA